MLNLAMKRLLDRGELIDVSVFPEFEPGVYRLNTFIEDRDYADVKKELWIWSIGRDLATGIYYASVDARFYQNPLYHCVWLR